MNTHTYYSPYPTILQDDALEAVRVAQELVHADMRGESVDPEKLLLARSIDSLGQTVAALTIGLQMSAAA